MQVRQIRINDLLPGMIPAEDLAAPFGSPLAQSDLPLTDMDIVRMRYHNVESLPVFFESAFDADSSDSSPVSDPSGLSGNSSASDPSGLSGNSPVSDPSVPIGHSAGSSGISYFEQLHESEEFAAYSAAFAKTVTEFETLIRQMIDTGCQPDNDRLTGCVQSLLNFCSNGNQVIDMIHCIRSYDDITFAHSVNVSLIAAVIGRWLNLNDSDIDILIQCGIYHDVGKLLIPKTVVEKPAQLTPEEFSLMKTHTMRGYNILRTKKLDHRVMNTAMLHHERCDGSGYPLGIKRSEIDDFSRILALADVYDAMTSPRVYRKQKSPFHAIQNLETSSINMFDPEFQKVFTGNICRRYIGSRINLTNGTIASITALHEDAYSRPLLTLADGRTIDLADNPSLLIDTIL